VTEEFDPDGMMWEERRLKELRQLFPVLQTLHEVVVGLGMLKEAEGDAWLELCERSFKLELDLADAFEKGEK